MADLSDLQAAQTVKIIGSNSTGTETNPIGVLPDNHALIGQQTFISTVNSSTTPLNIGATFTGTGEEVVNYSTITVAAFADQSSATAGLKAEWSEDNINWDFNNAYTLTIGVPRSFSFPTVARYFRMVYVNGTVAQGAFRLQVTYHYIPTMNVPSQKMSDDIVNDTDAIVTKSSIIGKDPDTGTYNEVAVDVQGRLITAPIAGIGADFSFGDITTSSTNRVVVNRTAYIEQTSNSIRSIASSSANDTAAGTGAHTVEITYLTSAGLGPYYVTVTLNGTSYVNTAVSDICFIEQIRVITAGSTLSNVGTLTIKAASAGGGVTIGTILPTDNQTFWAHHYVPAGKECNVTGISIGHNGTTVGSGALLTLNVYYFTIANSSEIQLSDFVRLYGQSSTFSRTYQSPIKINGPARVLAYLTPETSSTITYRAAFDFFEL